MSFDFNTLVTNRTQQDVAYARYLAEKLVAGTATEAEKAEWNSFALKGVYNHTDLNRVTVAMDILKAKMESYGYTVPNYKKIELPYPSTGGKVHLPDGYLELSYIESTGTQYIDTGFSATSTNIRVVCDWQYTKAPSDDSIFGSQAGGAYSVVPYAYSSTILAYYVGKTGALNKSTVAANARYLLDLTANAGTLTTTLNGSTATATYTQPFESAYSIYVFANNSSGSAMQKTNAKLYSMQIYDNGTLVRNYVPCINPFGDVGLFDVVSQQFYGNSGTGAFVAGNRVGVSLPSGYTQVEYIQSNGTQYIDTNYIPTSDNLKVSSKFAISQIQSWMSMFGSENATNAQWSLIAITNDSSKLVFYTGTSAGVGSVPVTAGQVYGLTCQTVNGSLTYNCGGTTGSVAVSGTVNKAQTLYIFTQHSTSASNTANQAISMKLYAFQIYDNGVLVRDYVPCISSAGAAGLYDIVNGVFYQNAGTGTFTVGNSIASATQSSGGSNLNSGKVTLKNLVADGSFETTNTWSTWSTDALMTEQAHLGTKSLKLTGDQLAQIPVERPIVGHKYYAREYIKTDGEVTIGDGRFEVHGGDGVGLNWVYGLNRGNYPDWTIQSDVHKIEAVNASSYVLRTFKVGGSGTAYVDGVMLIDLTATFGSGFEPDKEWCDTHIPFFEGSKVLTLPPRYNWQEYDIPTVHQLSVYLANVAIIRSVLAVMETTPDVPISTLNFMFQEANDIEQILLDVSRQLNIMATTFIPCGEALCGGDNL